MKLLKALCAFILVASPAFAGQDSSGGPRGVASEQLIQPIDPSLLRPELINIPSLGLPTRGAALDDYRRAAARLSVSPQSTLRVEGRLKEVKNLEGGIVDLGESTQFLPDTLIEKLP